jgi:hypothetical protein
VEYLEAFYIGEGGEIGQMCISPYIMQGYTDAVRGPVRDVVVGDVLWMPRYLIEKYTEDDHEHFGFSEYFMVNVVSVDSGNFMMEAFGSNANLQTEKRWKLPFSNHLNKPEFRKWVRILTPAEVNLFLNASVRAWVWSEAPKDEKWVEKKVPLHGPLLSWLTTGELGSSGETYVLWRPYFTRAEWVGTPKLFSDGITEEMETYQNLRRKELVVERAEKAAAKETAAKKRAADRAFAHENAPSGAKKPKHLKAPPK